MREIHDGVGAHLVLLLNMTEQGSAASPVLLGHIQQQARMAVDAMQPVHGDLGTVLATMRYRLRPGWKPPACRCNATSASCRR